jgi:hypothetical protein
LFVRKVPCPDFDQRMQPQEHVEDADVRAHTSRTRCYPAPRLS